jgi:hypothetical protein
MNHTLQMTTQQQFMMKTQQQQYQLGQQQNEDRNFEVARKMEAMSQKYEERMGEMTK